MTAPTDSFAAVVAELRDTSTKVGRLRRNRYNDLATRIECLDAEMVTIYSDLDAECLRWRDENIDLRARLAACEKDAERYRKLRLNFVVSAARGGYNDLLRQRAGEWDSPHTSQIMDATIDALASRPSPGAMGGEGEK